jgi:integrase
MPTKQKDGRYRTRVVVGHKANGDAIIKYASGKTKKELAENVDRIKAEQMGPRPTERKDITVKEYGSIWFEAYKEPNLRASTSGMYEYILGAHIYPALGARQLRAITPVELQLFVNGFSGRSISLINKVVLTLRQLFKRAQLDGLVDRNPMVGVIIPKGKQEPKRALTEEERAAIEHTGTTHPEGLLLLLLYYAGLRRGEAVGLQWGDIDFDAGVIRVQRQISYVSGVAHRQEPKTIAGKRAIPLLAPLRDTLWPRCGLPSTYVLTAPETGGYLPAITFRRRWDRLMAAAGTPGVTPHMLRHNFATVAYEAGIDELEATRILGHEDYKTTANIYTHLREDKPQQSAKKLEKAFANKGKKKNVAKMLPGSGKVTPEKE